VATGCRPQKNLPNVSQSSDSISRRDSLNHIPRIEYKTLFGRIYGWLRPGGLFLSSFGAGDCEGRVEEDWLGAPNYFSSYPGEIMMELFQDSGFLVERCDNSVQDESGNLVAFLWIFGRSPDLCRGSSLLVYAENASSLLTPSFIKCVKPGI
jgi:hypothetical protein